MTLRTDVKTESPARSILKSISWRVVATITTTLIVYFWTHEWVLAFTVGGVEVVAKFALYYVHERMWQRISFGRN